MADKYPFENFGKELRRIRNQARKSLIDVSGAVELDAEVLRRIESGQERPSKELVVLLINLFELEEKQAVQLWNLAGYQQRPHQDEPDRQEQAVTQVLLPAVDARVLYTDMVNVSANDYGLVISFLQGLSASNQPLVVSRVGMSMEHAASLQRILSDTLRQVEQRRHPKSSKKPPTDQQTSQDNNTSTPDPGGRQ